MDYITLQDLTKTKQPKDYFESCSKGLKNLCLLEKKLLYLNNKCTLHLNYQYNLPTINTCFLESTNLAISFAALLSGLYIHSTLSHICNAVFQSFTNN